MSRSLKNNKHIYGYSLDEVTTTNQGFLSQLFGISSAVMQFRCGGFLRYIDLQWRTQTLHHFRFSPDFDLINISYRYCRYSVWHKPGHQAKASARQRPKLREGPQRPIERIRLLLTLEKSSLWCCHLNLFFLIENVLYFLRMTDKHKMKHNSCPSLQHQFFRLKILLSCPSECNVTFLTRYI